MGRAERHIPVEVLRVRFEALEGLSDDYPAERVPNERQLAQVDLHSLSVD